MAAPRVVLRSRCLLSRNLATAHVSHSVLPSIRSVLPKRQFASGARLWQDSVETSATGSELPVSTSDAASKSSDKSSIVILKLPKRAVKSEIEALLQSKGFEIKKIQIRMDRFTFHNNTICFVELGSEKEAAEAIKHLDNSELQHSRIFVKPIVEDFVWGKQSDQTKTRYFIEEGDNAREYTRPLLEGRRLMLSVQTPGWGDQKNRVGERHKVASGIINQYFGKYGIESISDIAPFFGDKKENPRLLCFVDFETKEGADQAAAEHHDTEIEGRRTWLKLSEIAPWRAHQIGRVSQALLAELQEKGLAPQETYMDKRFATPLEKPKVAKKTLPNARRGVKHVQLDRP